MSALRDILKAEEERILALLAPLREQSAGLEAELRDVRRALFALTPPEERKPVPRLIGSNATIQDMIATVLADFPYGTTAKRIVQDVSVTFGRHVSRESLAPQLSRMERSGELVHEGKLWMLAPQEARLSSAQGSDG